MLSAPRPGMHVSPDIVLVQSLCEGGMGAVWVAEHRKLRTEVAVKFIAQPLAGDPSVRARFEREATSASRVRSPYVVQMLDYGVSPEGHPFLVMELLEGRDLRARLKDARPLTRGEVRAIVKQLAHALGRAHERGIVHRDLKPSNVFLCDSASGPLVKLLDFGIAKEIAPSGAETTTGVLGTPYYMSPEQLRGEGPIDPGCDVWALGVLVFEMLTGQRPFVGTTPGALALAVHSVPRPSARALVPSLPEALDAWFARACACDPAQRFASAAEAARVLDVALDAASEERGLSESTATGTELPIARGEVRPRRMRVLAASLVLAGISGLLASSAWSRATAASTKRPHASASIEASLKAESRPNDVYVSSDPPLPSAPPAAAHPRRPAPATVPVAPPPAPPIAPAAPVDDAPAPPEPMPSRRAMPLDRK